MNTMIRSDLDLNVFIDLFNDNRRLLENLVLLVY
jgi:hypothetical protein